MTGFYLVLNDILFMGCGGLLGIAVYQPRGTQEIMVALAVIGALAWALLFS